MHSRALFGAALLLVTLIPTGCSLTGTAAPSLPEEPELAAPMSGIVHGGQNPVSGATVQLWIMGLTGYGSAATPLGAPVTTAADGGFNIPRTYTCPVTNSADQLLYLTATGGDPGIGAVNPEIKMMAVLAGPSQHGSLATLDTCANIKSVGATVYISEESTVAAVYALAQFFNPSTESFGTSATNFQGLINAVNIAGSLVGTSNGQVNTTYTPQGPDIAPGGYTNDTATPDSDKIALIADLLAACINSAGSSGVTCGPLFSAAAPPPAPATTTLGSSFTYPAATDTLMAAYYLAVNPTNATTAGVPNTANTATLYGVASAYQQFPFSEPQPTDWTISVVYSSTTYPALTDGFISAPDNLSIDASGDVFYFTGSATASNVALGELNPYGGIGNFGISGEPINGYTLDAANYGYLSRLPDDNWLTYSLTNADSVDDGFELLDGTDASLDIEGAQLASDGTFVFETTYEVSSDRGSIFQIPGQLATGTPFTAPPTKPYAASTFYQLNAGHAVSGLTQTSPIVADSAQHLYVIGGSAVYKVPYTSTPPTSTTTGVTPVSVGGTLKAPSALAVDSANRVWIANTTGGTPTDGYISYYNGTTVTSDATDKDGGVNNPSALAIDGAGNIWVADEGQGTSYTGESVSEFALIGTALKPLSPSVGFAHSYNKPTGIAIDLSGNVWVANGVNQNNSTNTPGTITCILGAASPVVTPIAKGLLNGTQGTLP